MEQLASDAAQAKQAEPEEEDLASSWKRKKSSNRRNTPRSKQRNTLTFTENQEQEQLEQQHEPQLKKKTSDGENGSDGGEASAKESPRRPSGAGDDESLTLYSRRGSLSYGLPATYLVHQAGLEPTQQMDFRRKSSGDGNSSDSDGNKPWFLSRRANGTASGHEPISLESQLYSASGGEMGALFRFGLFRFCFWFYSLFFNHFLILSFTFRFPSSSVYGKYYYLIQNDGLGEDTAGLAQQMAVEPQTGAGHLPVLPVQHGMSIPIIPHELWGASNPAPTH
jgi:hypothetical protein